MRRSVVSPSVSFALGASIALGLSSFGCGGRTLPELSPTLEFETSPETPPVNPNNPTTPNPTIPVPPPPPTLPPSRDVVCLSNPPDTVALSFEIDDRANQTYTFNDRPIWRGSFSMINEDPVILEFDSAWSGPNPRLFDDGPCTEGGHEPPRARANDHIWSVLVYFRASPQDQLIEYGAENRIGWIWPGRNGTFTIPANAGSDVLFEVPGMTIDRFGNTDWRIVVDTNRLAPGFPPRGRVHVKSSVWQWAEIELSDDGVTNGDTTANDGVYAMELSRNVGPGTNFPHSGLLRLRTQSEFVVVIDGIEYKGEVPGFSGPVGLVDGVECATSQTEGNRREWNITRILRNPNSGNTLIAL